MRHAAVTAASGLGSHTDTSPLGEAMSTSEVPRPNPARLPSSERTEPRDSPVRESNSPTRSGPEVVNH